MFEFISLDRDGVLYIAAFLVIIRSVSLYIFSKGNNVDKANVNILMLVFFLLFMTASSLSSWPLIYFLALFFVGSIISFTWFTYSGMITPFGSGLTAISTTLLLCLLSYMLSFYETFVEHGFQAIFIAIFLFSIITSIYSFYYLPFSQNSLFYLNFKRNKKVMHIQSVSEVYSPKVTIHLPCYSEPPEIVINTLNSISALDYDNYEVIVIDNNTRDETLWKPVEKHCSMLGEKFRFYHVPVLAGAKAGALNYALKITSSDTELIAVIDADYITEPDFIRRYVKIFKDENVGFVQTSHDYYNHQSSPVMEGAYYFWTLFHKIELPSYTEINAAFTVGTMCILRRNILEKVGGWDETALTEDSELAVRMHAQGYIGYVFADTVGRGLIPTTFSDMKKQQVRWTAGPVQQLLKHWRLYFGFSSENKMTLNQRVMEIRHSTSRIKPVFSLISLHIMVVVSFFLLSGNVYLSIPYEFIVFFLCMLISTFIEKMAYFRLFNCSGILPVFYHGIMARALEWTFIYGVISSLFGFSMKWDRTNKFENSKSIKRAFLASKIEVVMSVFFFLYSFFLLSGNHSGYNDFVFLTGIACLVKGIGFLCALLVASLLENNLRILEAP
ncbi:putative glycosyl transferase [Pectobacterium atrosepticum SCRI1043]|uniref:Beta-monoglucosyldiacylglycerol synthase n=3 Tax=Pectobacterium TaxID=122277 RepID=Q6D4U6_PECAS|nr:MULTISPECIES: glycosyltransferase [Pectobacterium]AIA71104.1 glycosyl transferase [Pectobacterium atrosepticum]ATY90892.1 glycosyl transferase [Pectobacterium atrosepticum]KFX14112.1 glycosyl transferase [Pectobacterium atrosepticum]KFX25656.1 glycosyl transferase [Pectobacterium atrosepticum]KMK78944.1 putative glycosyl transferase [Pectobacterium atrosepticum ICMP 1526]